MTPAEAAEGRRLLDADADNPVVDNETTRWALEDWLWSNREALVRCAELAAGRTPDGASER